MEIFIIIHQLINFFTGAEAFGGAYFGQGNVSILVASFQCNGSESTLTACKHINTSVDCGHQKDVSVLCTTCLSGDVRLANGDQQRGQVEVCEKEKWTTICESLWDEHDAGVVCKQLGGYSIFGEKIQH